MTAARTGSDDCSPRETSIVIWGARGHAMVLGEFLTRFGHPIVATFDNDTLAVPPFPGVPLHYGQAGLEDWLRSQSDVRQIRGLVAVGGDRGGLRLQIQQLLMESGIAPLPAAIHDTAFVAADAKLGPGSQVLALAAVCTRAQLGAACIINTRASVDHEGQLGDGVHLAPGATLAGCVTVGNRTMIGAGAIVLPRIRIGHDTVVGAGAVVTRDLPDGVVACGNPARVVRANGPG